MHKVLNIGGPSVTVRRVGDGSVIGPGAASRPTSPLRRPHPHRRSRDHQDVPTATRRRCLCSHYRGRPDQGDAAGSPNTPVDLQRLLSTACLESSDPTSERPPRQHQHRLRSDELSQLKSEYLSGVEVKELAQRFGITRRTVIECMRREGVPPRYPKLGQGAIDKAASLYRSGWSLVAVGGALSVDPSTVRRVLLTQAVKMRDPQGRERRA
jgi:hypothetical protein